MSSCVRVSSSSVLADMLLFFFNDTATTEIYTLSLHDALPISARRQGREARRRQQRQHDAAAPRRGRQRRIRLLGEEDRKSTRLNSSHVSISYAVFCLKKKIISMPA